MRAHLIIPLLFLVLAACRNEPNPDPTPDPHPPPGVENNKGTSIKVGEEGVEVRSEDAAVKVTKDSASIDLPKK